LANCKTGLALQEGLHYSSPWQQLAISTGGLDAEQVSAFGRQG